MDKLWCYLTVTNELGATASASLATPVKARLLVSNYSGKRISIFPVDADGDVKSPLVLGGNQTGINQPSGLLMVGDLLFIALSADKKVLVFDRFASSNTLTSYPIGASGDVSARRDRQCCSDALDCHDGPFALRDPRWHRDDRGAGNERGHLQQKYRRLDSQPRRCGHRAEFGVPVRPARARAATRPATRRCAPSRAQPRATLHRCVRSPPQQGTPAGSAACWSTSARSCSDYRSRTEIEAEITCSRPVHCASSHNATGAVAPMYAVRSPRSVVLRTVNASRRERAPSGSPS